MRKASVSPRKLSNAVHSGRGGEKKHGVCLAASVFLREGEESLPNLFTTTNGGAS